jgi:hypothetical protein
MDSTDSTQLTEKPEKPKKLNPIAHFAAHILEEDVQLRKQILESVAGKTRDELCNGDFPGAATFAVEFFEKHPLLFLTGLACNFYLIFIFLVK